MHDQHDVQQAQDTQHGNSLTVGARAQNTGHILSIPFRGIHGQENQTAAYGWGGRDSLAGKPHLGGRMRFQEHPLPPRPANAESCKDDPDVRPTLASAQGRTR